MRSLATGHELTTDDLEDIVLRRNRTLEVVRVGWNGHTHMVPAVRMRMKLHRTRARCSTAVVPPWNADRGAHRTFVPLASPRHLPYPSTKATSQEAIMALSPKHILRHVVLAIAALFALFVVAQVAQLVSLASSLHPLFGTAVAIGIIGGIGWIVAVPLLAYLRLDPALVPPPGKSGPEHEEFVRAYLAVLQRNPRFAGRALASEADLESALAELEREAEAVANRHASHVFLGTAVSQYGSLDALIVAFTQVRMVWEIGHVFQQRPSLRQLGYLYANVLATSLVASRLERVDLSEYLRPVLAGVLGQSVATVPGVAAVSGHVSNAVFQGSVNAFLTLRVAMVAIAYSRATVRPESNAVWRSAVARAGHLAIRTITIGWADVSKAFAIAAAKTVGSGVAGVGHAVATGATKLGHDVVTAGTKTRTAVGHAAKGAGETVTGLGFGTVGTVRGAAEILGKRVRRPKGNATDAAYADGAPSDVPGDADEA